MRGARSAGRQTLCQPCNRNYSLSWHRGLSHRLRERAPSLANIYIIHNQWYWSYEISDFDTMATCMDSDKTLKYTCYLLTEESISQKNYLGYTFFNFYYDARYWCMLHNAWLFLCFPSKKSTSTQHKQNGLHLTIDSSWIWTSLHRSSAKLFSSKLNRKLIKELCKM